MQDKRTNAGYEIIQSIPVGNTEFVLGESHGGGAKYVTWECKDGTNYFWGHYFMERENAVNDLYDRVENEVAFKRKFATSRSGATSEQKEQNRAKKNRDREER